MKKIEEKYSRCPPRRRADEQALQTRPLRDSPNLLGQRVLRGCVLPVAHSYATSYIGRNWEESEVFSCGCGTCEGVGPTCDCNLCCQGSSLFTKTKTFNALTFHRPSRLMISYWKRGGLIFGATHTVR